MPNKYPVIWLKSDPVIIWDFGKSTEIPVPVFTCEQWASRQLTICLEDRPNGFKDGTWIVASPFLLRFRIKLAKKKLMRGYRIFLRKKCSGKRVGDLVTRVNEILAGK